MPEKEADQIITQGDAFLFLEGYYLQALEIIWDSDCSSTDENWLKEYLDNLVSIHRMDYRFILSCEYKSFELSSKQ